MKYLISATLLILSWSCWSAVKAPSQAELQMQKLILKISQMPDSDRRSSTTINEIQSLFTHTCLSGAKESASEDLKSGQMSQQQVDAMLKLVQSKCQCVIENPNVMDAFFVMADTKSHQQAEQDKTAKQFQEKVMKAMSQCLSTDAGAQ